MYRIVAALALSCGLSTAAWAQSDYPNKPIRFLNPFAPGVLRDFRCPSVRD